MTWHAEPALLDRYRNGAIDEAGVLSVEAHLMRCPLCRGRLADGFDPDHLDRMWEGIASAVDAPRLGPVERGLVRLGFPDHLARLMGATRSLRLSWFLAVGLALGFSVVSARLGDVVVFLALAPLVPLAGVAAAYGPGVDPTYEIGLAAPMRSFRLLLFRAVAVLTTSIILAGTAALALPHLDWTAAAWLLPSFALTSAALALSSVLAPLRACGVVALAWGTVVGWTEWWSGVPLLAFRANGQVALAAVLLAAAAILIRRRDSFEQRRTA